MKLSVVVCEKCNRTATTDMVWIKYPGGERLVCPCGCLEFMLLDVDEEVVLEGSLVIEKSSLAEKEKQNDALPN